MKSKYYIGLGVLAVFFVIISGIYVFLVPKKSTNLITVLSVDNTEFKEIKSENQPEFITNTQLKQKLQNLKITPKEPVNAKSVKVPILMYHHIAEVTGAKKNDAIEYGLSVSPQAFEKQMEKLKAKNYNTITSQDLDDFYRGNKDLPSNPILLTFDDGWKDNLDNALPILKKYNFKGDFAIIINARGGEYMTWEDLITLKNAGMGFSSHTVNHCYLSIDKPNETNKKPSPKNDSQNQECPQFLFSGTLNTAQIRGELANSKQILQDKLGVKITNLVYPFGRYNDDVARIAKEVGYSFGMSTNAQPGEIANLQKPFDLGRTRINGQIESGLTGFFASI